MRNSGDLLRFGEFTPLIPPNNSLFQKSPLLYVMGVCIIPKVEQISELYPRNVNLSTSHTF